MEITSAHTYILAYTYFLLTISVALFGVVVSYLFSLGHRGKVSSHGDDSHLIAREKNVTSTLRMVLLLLLLIVSIIMWLCSAHALPYIPNIVANFSGTLESYGAHSHSLFTWQFWGDFLNFTCLLVILYVTARIASVAINPLGLK